MPGGIAAAPSRNGDCPPAASAAARGVLSKEGPMPSRSFTGAACALGFALGGFFDGILLHQILQWHHLLSSLRTGVLSSLAAQVVADGVFHALMYLVALAALWLAARARGEFAAPGAGRRFLALALVGFGAWHGVDAVLSHWITGIHRIRMDVADPLAWDLAWLAAFGALPLALGLVLKRGAKADGGGGSGGRSVGAGLPLGLVAATAVAGWVAARPADGGEGTLTVVMRPGASAGRLLTGPETAEARLLWIDASQRVLVLQPKRGVRRLALYRAGAMYVGGTLLPAGCSAWLRTVQAPSPG
jgi:uncharacterized membrane protein